MSPTGKTPHFIQISPLWFIVHFHYDCISNSFSPLTRTFDTRTSQISRIEMVRICLPFACIASICYPSNEMTPSNVAYSNAHLAKSEESKIIWGEAKPFPFRLADESKVENNCYQPPSMVLNALCTRCDCCNYQKRNISVSEVNGPKMNDLRQKQKQRHNSNIIAHVVSHCNVYCMAVCTIRR